LTDDYFVLSQCMHLTDTDRQRDRRTDRQKGHSTLSVRCAQNIDNDSHATRSESIKKNWQQLYGCISQ